jgi:hypothetical protein
VRIISTRKAWEKQPPYAAGNAFYPQKRANIPCNVPPRALLYFTPILQATQLLTPQGAVPFGSGVLLLRPIAINLDDPVSRPFDRLRLKGKVRKESSSATGMLSKRLQ